MKILRTSLFTALGLAGLTGVASANAFNINEHDARVTGRGGATAASNDDASAIVFNPGGVAISEGTTIAIGTSLYVAQGSYENAMVDKTTTDSGAAVVPNLYVTSRVHDLLAVGIGLHLPFGLSVSWPEGHAQSGLAQDSNLRTFYISPVVGLNLNKYVPGLTIGGGPDLVPATVELERTLTFADTQGSVRLAGDAFGVGFRAGVMYHPPAVKGLKLGVMYRSKVKLDFEGTGDIDIDDPFRGALPPDGDISTTITLPQAVSGGVAYSPVKNLEVEFNAVWINWAQTFTPDGRTDDSTSLSITLPDGSTSDLPQDYENTVTYRLGLDYHIPGPRVNVRAGFIYDPSPIPTTTLTAQLPDVNRINLTLGASKYINDTLSAHLGLLWVTPGERDTDDANPYEPIFKGTYGVQAFVMSLGLTGRFGGTKVADPVGMPKVAKK
jgi:long-chain fatty acid transport protein